jgi:FKBP-type peptidyl-prolyl cis-trans isomerase FklB
MSKILSIAVAVFTLAHVSVAWGQDALPVPGGEQQPPAAAAPNTPGAQQPAAGGAPLQRQQVSYVIGRNIGDDLRRNGIECDYQSIVAGIRDAMTGARPKWSDAELQAAMQSFQREMEQKAAGRAQQAQQIGAMNKKQADTFLAQNKTQPGVQTTATGLQYKVLKQGQGATPAAADRVRVHYRGTLLDGTEFDTSYGGEPAEFAVNEVIPGWTEALQKMRVGDKWQVFVPPSLAYGENPHPDSPIPPNSLLVFEVELLGVDGK